MRFTERSKPWAPEPETTFTEPAGALGSTAYLVYSHAQMPDAADATYEPRALVRGPASDVVLLKLSWAWLR